MPKINQEEFEVLKGLDEKWKWIARDEYDFLYVYEEKPCKSENIWMWWGNSSIDQIFEPLFQFIEREDESPYNITELIEEYEHSAEHVSHVVNEKVKALGKVRGELFKTSYESEETEVKNKVELKSWFEDDKLYVGEYVKHKINQLDEPEVKQLDKKIRELESYNDELIRDNNQFRNELNNQEVLSQEWISEKSIDTHVDTVNGEIQVTFILDDLKNLLVPKQEEVDRAYKDGYEKGKEYTFYKGYLEGLGDKGSEPETVADVITDFYKSLERLKEVLGTEVEELEE